MGLQQLHRQHQLPRARFCVTRAEAGSSGSTRYAAGSAKSSNTPRYDPRKKVVVVGGGWAGFGAAKHLAEQGYAVTLLEAAKNPGGLSGGGCVTLALSFPLLAS